MFSRSFEAGRARLAGAVHAIAGKIRRSFRFGAPLNANCAGTALYFNRWRRWSGRHVKVLPHGPLCGARILEKRILSGSNPAVLRPVVVITRYSQRIIPVERREKLVRVRQIVRGAATIPDTARRRLTRRVRRIFTVVPLPTDFKCLPLRHTSDNDCIDESDGIARSKAERTIRRHRQRVKSSESAPWYNVADVLV